MPELPDIEGFKECFEKHALNRRIRKISAPDERILEDLTVQGLGRRLKDREFKRAFRHGKFLFAKVDDEDESGWLAFHFGMTGLFAVHGVEQQAPDHTAVDFEFEDGTALAYVSQRMLGKITLGDTLEGFIQEYKLGPDALSENLSVNDCAERLANHRGMLKSALMNQSIIAGIGNEWSDEILFQCHMHPKVAIKDLGSDDLSELCRTGRRVLRTGSAANRNGRPLPYQYLGAHRHGDGLCPKCKSKLATVKVSSRTAYYCPQCQA